MLYVLWAKRVIIFCIYHSSCLELLLCVFVAIAILAWPHGLLSITIRPSVPQKISSIFVETRYRKIGSQCRTSKSRLSAFNIILLNGNHANCICLQENSAKRRKSPRILCRFWNLYLLLQLLTLMLMKMWPGCRRGLRPYVVKPDTNDSVLLFEYRTIRRRVSLLSVSLQTGHLAVWTLSLSSLHL